MNQRGSAHLVIHPFICSSIPCQSFPKTMVYVGYSRMHGP